MNFKILVTSNFSKQLKKLNKKYPSLSADISKLKDTLEKNPTSGISLGMDCYKIRIRISSKGKGKSGGARVITLVKITRSSVYLLALYDKSESESITLKELQYLIGMIA
jgi:mRNA-degrading endonuclease RelE of RelBE toxin-antitoxin system